MGMLDIHQQVVSDDFPSDVCSGLTPLPAGSVLHLKGDNEVPTKDQAFVKTQCAKVVGYLLVVLCHPKIVHKIINVNQVQR